MLKGEEKNVYLRTDKTALFFSHLPNVIKTSHFCRKLLLKKHPNERKYWKPGAPRGSALLHFFVFVFNILFWETVDSHAGGRSNRKILRPLHFVSSDGKSYIITVQHNNQDGDTDTTRQPCCDSNSFIMYSLCVYLVLCNLLHVNSNNHDCTIVKIQQISSRESLGLHFQSQPSLSPTNTYWHYF